MTTTDDLTALPTVELGQLHAAALANLKRADQAEQHALSALRDAIKAESVSARRRASGALCDAILGQQVATETRDRTVAEWRRRRDLYRARSGLFLCPAVYSGDPVHIRCEATQVRRWAALCEEHAPGMSFDVPTCAECCRQFDEAFTRLGNRRRPSRRVRKL